MTTTVGAVRGVVVTGSSGYVGGRLVGALGEHELRGIPLTRRPRPWLPNAVSGVDLLADDLRPHLDGADAVVHLAGHNETIAARDPRRAIHESLTMTEQVVEAAEAAGVERLVFVSTVHVYGRANRPGSSVSEAVPPEPESAYAISRLCCEHVVRAAPLDTVVLRLSNAVGAPIHEDVDRWTLLASDLVRSAVTSGRMTLRTPGLQWRDFVDLGYVCDVIARAVAGGVEPGTYNLASGRSHTVRDLARLIHVAVSDIVGRDVQLDAPPTEDEPTAAPMVSVDRLRSQGIGAPPPVEHSIEELVRFCMQREDRL